MFTAYFYSSNKFVDDLFVFMSCKIWTIATSKDSPHRKMTQGNISPISQTSLIHQRNHLLASYCWGSEISSFLILLLLYWPCCFRNVWRQYCVYIKCIMWENKCFILWAGVPAYYVMVSSTKNIIHAGIIYHHCMLVIRTIHHNPYNLVCWILDTGYIAHHS